MTAKKFIPNVKNNITKAFKKRLRGYDQRNICHVVLQSECGYFFKNDKIEKKIKLVVILYSLFFLPRELVHFVE